jgi:hypothetical protein
MFILDMNFIADILFVNIFLHSAGFLFFLLFPLLYRSFLTLWISTCLLFFVLFFGWYRVLNSES